uniref:Uncharacterized protein n=1 Tax=Sus scrofa TaxID=9823 RepID=A0A4X1VW81_PIG
MNQSLLTQAPHFNCHSVGSCVAIGHALPCLESKQSCPHCTGQAKADGGKETLSVSMSFFSALVAYGKRLT